MKAPVVKKPKEDKMYKCPNCKISIENFKELQVKIQYQCSSCKTNFFIIKIPKFYFNAQ